MREINAVFCTFKPTSLKICWESCPFHEPLCLFQLKFKMKFNDSNLLEKEPKSTSTEIFLTENCFSKQPISWGTVVKYETQVVWAPSTTDSVHLDCVMSHYMDVMGLMEKYTAFLRIWWDYSAEKNYWHCFVSISSNGICFGKNLWSEKQAEFMDICFIKKSKRKMHLSESVVTMLTLKCKILTIFNCWSLLLGWISSCFVLKHKRVVSRFFVIFSLFSLELLRLQ